MRIVDPVQEGSAGYFRIGDVVLSIPPERIEVSRASAAEELTVLTSRFPFLRRTGRARIDVSISWRAWIDWSGPEPDYSEWLKLRRIQAMVCAAPFVEVENAHLRQLMAAEAGLQGPAPMAFALRSLRVQTSADAVDCLEATLEMSWFDYAPFSRDFNYNAPSAAQSEAFRRYLDVWIESNIENARVRQEYPSLASWRHIAPNSLNFRWREYIMVPKGGDPAGSAPVTATPASLPAPSAHLVPGSVAAADRQAIQKAISDTARHYGVDPALALAVAEQESGFNPNADAGPGGGKGLFQLVVPTARNLGIPQDQIFDPVRNMDGGIRYLKWLLDRYQGSERDALAAYYVGPGAWDRVRASASSQARAEGEAYAASVLRRKAKYAGLEAPEAGAGSSAAAAPSAQSREVLYNAALTGLVGGGFLPDYETNQGAFLYRERLLHLCTEEYPCGRSHPQPNPAGMVPFSITMIWSSRLAPMPASSSELPTFQYCGPMSTLVLIGLHSRGEPDASGEPVHRGARQLAEALRRLERQYVALKPFWKKPSSLHRMQAMLVECQPLAFFGIYGLMPRMMTSSTVPESAEMIEVSLEAVQWENVYETIEAHSIKDPHSAAALAAAAMLEPDTSPLFREPEFTDLYNVLQRRLDKALAEGKFQALVESSGILQSLNVAEQAEIRARNGLAPSDPIRTDHLIRALRRSLRGQDSPVLDAVRLRLQEKILSAADDASRLALLGEISEEAEQSPGLASRLELLRQSSYIRSRLPQSVYRTRYRNCYRHMGLPPDQRLHPAGYFRDEQEEAEVQLRQQSEALSERICRSLEQLNVQVLYGMSGRSQKDGEFRPDVRSSYSDSVRQMADLVGQAVRLGGRSMKQAFPVCRVFLVNEEARIPLFRFDDFYSANAVIGFEIIRYRDQPDMLLLRVSNGINLLRFRLFDSSIQGRYEKRNARMLQLPVSRSGEPLTGPGGMTPGLEIEVEPSGVDRVVIDDLSHQVRVPLQMYPLQTGSKIEVRAGYEDDPDRLPVVFSGLVTAIEDGEIMEITAHGFAIELAVPVPDEIRSDHFGFSWITAPPRRLLAAGGSLLSGDFSDALGLVRSSLDRAPAYGGFRFLGEAGDATTVISEMLRVSTARHFGDWIVLVPAGEVAPLKGWAQARLKDVAGWIDPKLERLLGSVYSRRNENIVVAGRVLSSGGRLLLKENEQRAAYLMAAEGPFFLAAAYSIPARDAEKLTPWRIIQDIRRRYPTHELLVKHYGYPHRTEATLVFAHPSDFYYARLPYPGEWEEVRDAAASGRADSAFFQWWRSGGRSQLESAVLDAPELPSFASGSVRQALAEDLARVEKGGMFSFLSLMEEYAAIAARRAAMLSVPIVGEVGEMVMAPFNLLSGRTLRTSEAANPATWRNLQRNLARIRDDAVAYVRRALRAAAGQSDDSPLTARTRPVRKYFFASSSEILHNGISLNENIFNAVRVTDSNVIVANSGIASCQYPVRVLDCRDLLINYRQNVVESRVAGRVAQSFLKEELGRMYRGELILRGAPEIEPGDIVFLDDFVNDMQGPVVVESVIHQFDADSGFITIVRPAALVAVNDVSCLGIFHGLADLFRYLGTFGRFEAAQMMAGFSDQGTMVDASGRRVASYGPRSAAETNTMIAAGALAGGAALAAGVAAGPAPLTGLLSLTSGAAAGLASALSASLAVLLAVPVFMMASFMDSRSPVFLIPLSRSGYPWVAGIDGWEMQSIARHFWSRWDRFFTEELGPYFESLRILGQTARSL